MTAPEASQPETEARPPEGIFLARPERQETGIPLAVKDLFDTAGLETTYGSAVYAGHVPERTAAAVELMERAGYANVGKTNLHEFAYGITSENEHYGTVPNPIAPGRIAGGSSGGSAAAIAAGLVPVALGSDTGGSIRIPAACCGVVGFKPSWGLVPSDGCFPLVPGFDCAGPLASDVAGCSAAMAALAPGLEPAELSSLAGLRVGIANSESADPLVRARVVAAARFFDRAEPAPALSADGVAPYFMAEVAAVHRSLWATHRERYGANVAAKLEQCMAVSAEDRAAGREAVVEHRERAREIFARYDLIVSPTIPTVAPPVGLGDLALRGRMTMFTLPANVIGAPAIALPCGPAEDGLPASIQLIGAPGADGLVLAAAARLERGLVRN